LCVFSRSAGLSLKEIGHKLHITDKYKQLEAIDTLADQKVANNNSLPVRGHFLLGVLMFVKF
jgi:hypothetical protein